MIKTLLPCAHPESQKAGDSPSCYQPSVPKQSTAESVLPWIQFYLTVQYHAVAMGTGFNDVFFNVLNLMTSHACELG